MGENRQGKHDPDKVLIGVMVTPEFKALLQLVANMNKCQMAEVITKGVELMAVQLGILRNGQIATDYKEAIDAMADIIRTNLSNKRKGNS